MQTPLSITFSFRRTIFTRVLVYPRANRTVQIRRVNQRIRCAHHLAPFGADGNELSILLSVFTPTGKIYLQHRPTRRGSTKTLSAARPSPSLSLRLSAHHNRLGTMTAAAIMESTPSVQTKWPSTARLRAAFCLPWEPRWWRYNVPDTHYSSLVCTLRASKYFMGKRDRATLSDSELYASCDE